ncbi:MAG: GTPase Era [Myxococcales bacterium]|nr:GTPase Era [Polyangiaceae bacterium]MDW8250069.1 GTPase Era [Myxococcales bacterium]
MRSLAVPSPKRTSVRRAGLVALVGRSNVGKSTLMNVLLGEALAIVAPTPQTTRHRILGVLQRGDAQIGLLDTPGLHRPQNRLGKLMNTVARSAVEEADVVLFVTAPLKEHGRFQVSPGDKTLLEDIGKGKPMILVVNKVDLVRPKQMLLPVLGELANLRAFAAVVPISARREDGLDRLLGEVTPLLPERGALWSEDDLTDRPVRFFVAEFVRGEILNLTREEVPYGVTVTVESFLEASRVTRIQATVHVDRENHKPILIGKGGSRLREIGTAARKRVEALLGQRVHLELFVRVTEGWAESPERLREFGYDEGKAS